MAFGDIRVSARADWLVERIATLGTVTLRRLGATRAGEMSVHRFLSSPHVSPAQIVATTAARTAARCCGRRILAVQDTTEINFAGRDKKRRGLGPGGDGKTPGFFIHAAIAVDADDAAVVGLVDARIWTRRAERVHPRRERPLEEKESMRWLDGCTAAAARLAGAASVTMVADRESDIYQLFARRPAGLDLIVRAGQDRTLAGTAGRLFDALAEGTPLCHDQVRVAPRRPGDKGRTAAVALSAGTVTLARPATDRPAGLPEALTLTLVEARESAPPEGKAPLLWRLLTTHSVETAADAKAIVQLYRLRWRIEQMFRALKSDGIGLDDTQVIDAGRLFNLTAVALAAAVRTIQLVDARDGSTRPDSDVLDDTFRPALERLSRKLEGNTARQKNPHPPGTLAFLAWIVARLGGWNCYYKPPGPKTMRTGWNQLAPMLAGYALANHHEIP